MGEKLCNKVKQRKKLQLYIMFIIKLTFHVKLLIAVSYVSYLEITYFIEF